MFRPGDVVAFYSHVAGKRKFHLCISLNDCFLFLNSPKAKTYPGDLEVDCAEFPFLDVTASGRSIVSCSMVLTFTKTELQKAKATKVGEAKRGLMLKILKEIEDSALLSEAEREAVLEGLGDFF